MSSLNDKDSLNLVRLEIKESYLHHNGWIKSLDKFINVSTGSVCSEIPLEID